MNLNIANLLGEGHILDISEYYQSTVKIKRLKYLTRYRGEEITIVCGDVKLVTDNVKFQNILNLIQLIGEITIIGKLPPTKRELTTFSGYDRLLAIFDQRIISQLESQVDILSLVEGNLKLSGDLSPVIDFITSQEENSKKQRRVLFTLIQLKQITKIGDKKYVYKGVEFEYDYNILLISEMYRADDKLIISGLYTGTSGIAPIIQTNQGPVQAYKVSHQSKNKLQEIEICDKFRVMYRVDIEQLTRFEFEGCKPHLTACSNRFKKLVNCVIVDDKLIEMVDSQFTVKPKSKLKLKLLERKLVSRLRNAEEEFPKHLISEIKKYKKQNKRNVVIISDRINKADDNGEFFLRYATAQADEFEYYYAISSDSPDYSRLGSEFNVIDPNSIDYLKLLTRAVYLVSSHSTSWIQQSSIEQFNPAFIGLYTDFKYVFLQHGILLNDLSFGMSKMRTGIDYFFTTTEFERNHVITSDYMFEDQDVVVTGMSRLDNLFGKDKEKKIVYMPTWRGKLQSNLAKTEDDNERLQKFAESDFCKGINQFLDNPKLQQLLASNGFKLMFVPHPNLEEYLNCFNFGANVELIHGVDVSYSGIIATSRMLITDYSSVMFDAMYAGLNVYSYFPDFDTIADNHYIVPSGVAFDQQTPLLEINYGSDEMISLIEKQIDNQFTESPIIMENRQAFFTYMDNNNCQRVYEQINKIGSDIE